MCPQARSQAVQKQLAKAAAELAELKARQEQLEARGQSLQRSSSFKREIVNPFTCEVQRAGTLIARPEKQQH